MKLELIGEYDYNDQQVIRKVVNGLQSQFDINPVIIQNWLDRDDFGDHLLKMERECYRQVMDRENTVLDRLLDASHAESLVDDCLFWEKELCGQVLDECGNGFIKYCNQHKYLHIKRSSGTNCGSDEDIENINSFENNSNKRNRNDKENKGNNNNTVITDHNFVRKNPNEIVEEQIFKVKFNMYLEITRNLAQHLENDFFQYISNLGYTEWFVKLNNNKNNKNKIDKDSDLSKWFVTHSMSFRSKVPVYQRDLDEIKNERRERETRTLRNLRTLRTLKGKKVKVKEEDQKVNQDPSDESNQDVYVKVYVLPTDKLNLVGWEIISRSIL